MRGFDFSFLKEKKFLLRASIYFAAIAVALLFLYFGNKIASSGVQDSGINEGVVTVEAKVVDILDLLEYDALVDGSTVLFEAVITKGEGKGGTVRCLQSSGTYYAGIDRLVERGDTVILSNFGDGAWHFIGFVRINKIVALASLFVVLLLLFGRTKGFNALLSLAFTCGAIFAVLIPSILSGRNIYISTMVVCAFTIVVTLVILYGASKKTLAAACGCFGGVVAAGLLMFVMNNVLELTGLVDDDSIYLLFLPTAEPIDLKAILFAGIVIGAVGAIMDVSVSISSALWELKEKAPGLRFGELFKSGVNIGRDIMGSMTNTLVLAYIGGSLSIMLVIIAYAGTMSELFNGEMVISELLRALIGSLGILLTMPLTALIAAALYTKAATATQDTQGDGSAQGAVHAED